MRRASIAIIAVLLAAFTALAYFAVASKSPTYDEPLHALGAWQHLYQRDFRVNPEDPPLWHYWAALPNGPKSIRADTSSDLFKSVTRDIDRQWAYTVETLYRTQGNDGDAFIWRSRIMMLIVAVALGVVIACCGWHVGGPIAAAVATAFYALDPNFLGHGPLVKNDVSLSLVTLGLAWAIWGTGRAMTLGNALAVCLLCAAAVTVKFSGLLLGPTAAILLLIRAFAHTPWQVFGKTLTARLHKVGAAAALCVAALVISYFAIWACYGFRFYASPEPNMRLGFGRLMIYTATADLVAKTGDVPSDEQVRQWEPTLVPRALLTLVKWHALPEPWLFGLLYTYQSSLARRSFLLGYYSYTGWWYYFPLAMLFKSSITLLLSVSVAGSIAFSSFKQRSRGAEQFLYWTWPALCLGVPPLLYLLAAMKSNLNLGVRHVLPVFPFIYIGLGLAAGRLYTLRPKVAPRLAAVVIIALAIEALVAFPNYIAFFNVAVGGPRGGLALLGDSNLDWGQDLKLLAKWRKQNPQGRFYMIYFGTADPAAYGITEYINFPGGYRFGPEYEVRSDPGVLAVSATMLQGVYAGPQYRTIYSTLRKLTPFEVLGGTIYLYQWPPPEIPQ